MSDDIYESDDLVVTLYCGPPLENPESDRRRVQVNILTGDYDNTIVDLSAAEAVRLGEALVAALGSLAPLPPGF